MHGESVGVPRLCDPNPLSTSNVGNVSPKRKGLFFSISSICCMIEDVFFFPFSNGDEGGERKKGVSERGRHAKSVGYLCQSSRRFLEAFAAFQKTQARP